MAGPPGARTTGPGDSLGALFRDLARDGSTLICPEVALAKTELRGNVQALAKDAVRLPIGGGILLVSVLLLTAALVALLGHLLGDAYRPGALFAGVVRLRSGTKWIRHDDLRPDRTITSLREDRRWAQAEVKRLEHDLRS